MDSYYLHMIKCGNALRPGIEGIILSGKLDEPHLITCDLPADSITTIRATGASGFEKELHGSFSIVLSNDVTVKTTSATGGPVAVQAIPCRRMQEANGRTIALSGELPKYSKLFALVESVVSDGVHDVTLPALTEIETFFPVLVSGTVRIRVVL